MSSVQFTAREYGALQRRHLSIFTERVFRELHPQTLFLPSPHIEVLASRLQVCLEGGYRRLIVNMPPRTLKSLSVSVAFTAHLLGLDPSKQIICASYGQDLADKLARDSRTIMSSTFYKSLFPRTRLSAQKNSVNDFATTAQGGRMSTSVGGVLTGRGADFIIIDDPLKPEDALSESGRNGTNQWFDNTLLSRLNNKEKGVIIIVMQRLHQDDLVGHVQATGGWEVLLFSAIAEEEEIYKYEGPFGPAIFRRSPGAGTAAGTGFARNAADD